LPIFEVAGRGELVAQLDRDPGLLGDLPPGRLLERLAGLELALGQGPVVVAGAVHHEHLDAPPGPAPDGTARGPDLGLGHQPVAEAGGDGSGRTAPPSSRASSAVATGPSPARRLRSSATLSSCRSSWRRRVPVSSSQLRRTLSKLRPTLSSASVNLVHCRSNAARHSRISSDRRWSCVCSTAWRMTASTENSVHGEQSTTFCRRAKSTRSRSCWCTKA